jgi:hypothetical protein
MEAAAGAEHAHRPACAGVREAVPRLLLARWLPCYPLKIMAAKWLTIAGLVVTLVGAGCGFYGVWVSPSEAIVRGVSRWSGGTREEQLKLPTVQTLLTQSRFAMIGFGLIGVGTALQIVSVFLAR